MSEKNKIVVQRFNQQVITEGKRQAFEDLVADSFINHSAPAGTANDRESFWRTFTLILRPALTDLQVSIEQQIAEGEWVTTRKTLTGVHSGELLGVAATGKNVAIAVIDMVRIVDGQYVEHWGVNTLAQVVSQLKQG
ncbi:ester cyclase [Serratia rubidaea]|uniref:ester cyclase n=1 Tax=Serratia rubidaea TaxID=61652 RepID=UPI0022B8AC1F|nr:ester cyclase [Serratia rubidaea]WBF47577.1 ester cyclase [Serratia rubidaea]